MEKNIRNRLFTRRALITGGLMVAILAANAVVTRIMIAHSTPRVVAFDMKKTLDNFMDSVSRKQLTESQSKALSDRFNDALEKSLGVAAADSVRKQPQFKIVAVQIDMLLFVDEAAELSLDDPAAAYVSRAALKLIAGLDHFGFDVGGRHCLDIGASTGGFTEVLLNRGAASVIALDVGHGQLHPRIAADDRVTSLEGVNARDIGPDDLPFQPDVLVSDVSFISLRLLLLPMISVLRPQGDLVALIKPQFESQHDETDHGIVRDEAVRLRTVDEVRAGESLQDRFLSLVGGRHTSEGPQWLRQS